ncbi:hypothetical protein KR222_010104, partial [Zaprionus bogoriensis]
PTTNSHATQSSTLASSSAHDELGNLLWQQEATEFIEQFPVPCGAASQSHSRRCPLPPIRHCHAHAHGIAGAGGGAGGGAGAGSGGGGELLSTQQRHQRDMFSGDLGIPEINTHVGSVVHTFETLALQRRLAEAEQERDRQQSKYELRTSHSSGGNSQSKYSQVKRRSQELHQRLQQMQRQRLRQQAQPLALAQLAQSKAHPTGVLTAPAAPTPAPLGKLANSCSTQSLASLPRARPSPRAAHSTEQLPYEDYRKNLFGTLVRPVFSEEELQDETYIVNAAFDEIFARYDDDGDGDGDGDGEEGAGTQQPQDTSRSYTNTNTNTDDLFDDEHMLVSLSELDDEVFASRTQTASTTPTKASAMRTPKHSHPLQKYPAPAPPLQERSSTLANLFERLKPAAHSKRTNSEQQLQPTATAMAAAPTPLHKYAAQPQLNAEPDFNRGSTLSQSFVRQLRRVSHKQKRAPPAPPPKPQSNVAHVTPLRNALIFPKRSRSSNELLLDDLSVQARKYFRRPEHSAAV